MFRKTEYKLDKDYVPIGRDLLVVDKFTDNKEFENHVLYEKRPNAIAHSTGPDDSLGLTVEGNEVLLYRNRDVNNTTSKKDEDT